MKITEITSIPENDYPGENENFYNLISFLSNVLVELSTAFAKRINLDDNLDCVKFEYTFTDMVPVKFKNPTKFKKNEILTCNAVNQMITGYSCSYTQSDEIVITVKFQNAGATDKCIVRVI